MIAASPGLQAYKVGHSVKEFNAFEEQLKPPTAREAEGILPTSTGLINFQIFKKFTKDLLYV